MGETIEHLYDLVKSQGCVIGNTIKGPNGTGTPSVPLFLDSNSALQAAGFPFAVPLIAGVTSTSASVVSVEGSSTGTADDMMHQTLVAGANVTTFTKTGFLRVTVTDDAGNITNGAHYIQIGTLS